MVPLVTMSIMTDPGRWVRLEAIMAIMATMMGKLSHDWPGSTLWIHAARPNVPKRAPAPRQP